MLWGVGGFVGHQRFVGAVGGVPVSVVVVSHYNH